jgi:glutamyl-tRNA reductase
VELVFVGLNHQTAPVDVRDRLAIVPARLHEALAAAANRPGLSEVVLLSTCNRSEVWTVADGEEIGVRAIHDFLRDQHEVDVEQVRPHLYSHTGVAAVRHSFRVVSGLDSMVLGEPQIAGQVKEAFEAARSARTSGFLLERLHQHALRVHKRVRSETRLGEGAVSISYVAVELARKIFGDLSRRHVLVLGAGEMSELALQCLGGAGAKAFRVSNRTHHRAVELAERYRGDVVPWEDFPAALAEADIVIASTGAPHPVVRAAMVREAMEKRRNEPLCLIDIASPRDVEPKIADLYNVFLFNLDDLKAIAEENRRRREAEAEAAEQIVASETTEFLRWHSTLDVKSIVVALRKEFEAVRRQELERLKSKADEISPDDWKKVEQFSSRLLNKFLHGPLSGLRQATPADRAVELAETVRALFDLPDETDKEGHGDAAGAEKGDSD